MICYVGLTILRTLFSGHCFVDQIGVAPYLQIYLMTRVVTDINYTLI